MADKKELNWSGWATKKAFKSAAKQSWKKRWCVFNADSMEFSWHDAEGRPAKGSFVMVATDLRAEVTTEHGRDNELLLASSGTTLYISLESADAAVELLTRIDAAKRAALAADLGSSYMLVSASRGVENASPAEAATKAFSWGVGAVLGVDQPTWNGHSVPQRITALRSPAVAALVAAGPEHAAVVAADASVYLWGSNEFRQVGVPADTQKAWRPVPLSALSTRKVLTVACGGSHTLAVVADAAGAREGTLVGWGTGTVGQLGLGEGTQVTESPTIIPLPGTSTTGHRAIMATRVYAGLVSSCAVTSVGEVFVWGDASIGRLGLADISDPTPPGAVPALVNMHKVWQPQQLVITPSDVGADAGTTLSVVDVAMGGSYSMFLVHTGKGRGNVLLVTGSLGIDITRDLYGYPIGQTDADIQRQIEMELKTVPRRWRPAPIEPFNRDPRVLSVYAGARHAAVIAADEVRGGAPRVYTAGKGWLGHRDTKETRLLPQPTVTSFFAPVAGALESADVVDVACGHSHTLVRTGNHTMFVWGRGDSGELGQGSLSDQSMPSKLTPIDGHTFTAMGAGSYYTVALATPGSISTKSYVDILGDFRKRFVAILEAEAESRTAFAGGARSAPAPAPAPATVVATPAKAVAPAPAPAPAPAVVEEEPEAEAEEVAAESELDDCQYLPAGWDFDKDDEGKTYFIQPDGDTTWDDPRPLPAGWERDEDDEGTPYFTQPDGETTWDDPRCNPPLKRD